jgi:hypothetical protein
MDMIIGDTNNIEYTTGIHLSTPRTRDHYEYQTRNTTGAAMYCSLSGTHSIDYICVPPCSLALCSVVYALLTRSTPTIMLWCVYVDRSVQ